MTRLAGLCALARAAALVALVSLTPPAGAAGDPGPATRRALPPVFHQELGRAGIAAANVAVRLKRLDAASAPLTLNAEQPMNPASVMKLFTTFAALDLLGPSHRFATEVLVDGPVDAAGRLRGNLILRGGGDPKLMQEDLWRLLREIRQRGIRDIDGDLVLDGSVFSLPTHDPAAFDNEPLRPYNAGPDGLLLNLKSISLRLLPEAGNVRVLIETPAQRWQVSNRLRAVGGECGDWRERFRVTVEATRIDLSGEFATACGEKALNLSPAPDLGLADDLLRTLWHEQGGHVSGAVRAGVTPAGARLLTSQPSAPVGDLVRDINKFSNNLMARQLLLTLDPARPATPAGAEAEVSRWLAARGIDPRGFVLDNGAGLSRTARASARQIGELLDHAWASPAMPEFISSLPILGRDGTLKKRLNNGGAAGRAHLKTGYLAGTRSLAGYVLDQAGGRWSVVIVINDAKSAAARPAMDALIDHVIQGGLTP